jgi:hypothetical protein
LHLAAGSGHVKPPVCKSWGPLMRRLLILSVLLALGGCQLARPGGQDTAADAPPGNPIMGDAIEVTSLDAPAVPGGTPTVSPADAPRSDGAAPAEDIAQTTPDPAPEVGAAPVAVVEAAPAAVVAVKTPSHLACEKKGGRWSMAGSAKASFCQTPTRDAGRQCSASAECAGNCLAKSGTCAPYTPLMGCNDVLDDQGRMLTECIN